MSLFFLLMPSQPSSMMRQPSLKAPAPHFSPQLLIAATAIKAFLILSVVVTATYSTLPISQQPSLSPQNVLLRV
jgi:hypothetical protein